MSKKITSSKHGKHVPNAHKTSKDNRANTNQVPLKENKKNPAQRK